MKMLRALAFSFCLFTGSALAVCANSPQPMPQGAIGLQLVFADDAQSWETVRDLQVPWVRIELRLDWFNPQPGIFDWSYIDRVMAYVGRHNVRVMLLVNHAPKFYAQDLVAFPRYSAEAISKLTKRYQFAAVELFNEMNGPGFGWPELEGGVKGSALLYAQTLVASSQAIRSNSKDTLVISGGLTPSNDPETYLRLVLRSTPPQCVDGIGLHPYGQGGKFAAIQSNASLLLAQEGWPKTSFWFTEYGSESDSERGGVIHQLFSERSRAPITFFFSERDSDRFTHYGLLRYDRGEKPDYALFKRLMDQIQ